MGAINHLRAINSINEMYEKIIREKGREYLIKMILDGSKNKTSNLEVIKGSYYSFFKNLEIYDELGKRNIGKQGENSLEVKRLFEVLKKLKFKAIVFDLEKNWEEQPTKLNNAIIPFKDFYLASPVYFRLNDDVITTEGFFVSELDQERLYVTYFWSKCISDGWAPASFIVKKKAFIMETIPNDGFENDIQRNMFEKFKELIITLLIRLERKEYRGYKLSTPSGLVEKEIVFAHEVSSHKRHFWEDSGRFKIPQMSKEEILSKGYKIDELVFRDGELRRDVPYTIISSFKIDGMTKEKAEENRHIDLLNGKILRKENKLAEVLGELFDGEWIKRHDRKPVAPLELDFNIIGRNIAFEYDGEQHYDKKLCEDIFKCDFEELQKRDRRKDILCRKRGIILIRIKYDEEISVGLIKRKLKEKGIEL